MLHGVPCLSCSSLLQTALFVGGRIQPLGQSVILLTVIHDAWFFWCAKESSNSRRLPLQVAFLEMLGFGIKLALLLSCCFCCFLLCAYRNLSSMLCFAFFFSRFGCGSALLCADACENVSCTLAGTLFLRTQHSRLCKSHIFARAGARRNPGPGLQCRGILREPG